MSFTSAAVVRDVALVIGLVASYGRNLRPAADDRNTLARLLGSDPIAGSGY
jgi:hypothetical protein